MIPRRRWHIQIEVGGDSARDALHLLEEYAKTLRRRLDDDLPAGQAINICSGGYSTGGNVEAHHDPEMTHARYFERLDEWLAEREAGESSSS